MTNPGAAPQTASERAADLRQNVRGHDDLKTFTVKYNPMDEIVTAPSAKINK